jgi:hypothetical protein
VKGLPRRHFAVVAEPQSRHSMEAIKLPAHHG